MQLKKIIMIRLFIGLSKNQISSYEKLLRHKNFQKSKKVLITNKTLIIDLGLWDEVIYANKTFNNQSNSSLDEIKHIIQKIKQYKTIVKNVIKYKQEKKITLYFTYVEDLLTNFLLFSFNKNIKGVVIEDGTLNYYQHTIKSISQKKVFLKWFLSNIYGLRFKYYKGHSSGIESLNVNKQYVRAPELSMFPNKSEKLPYLSRKSILTNTFLIIGQEGYINQQGEKKYNQCLDELIEVIKSDLNYLNTEIIYYKPHRNGKRIDFDRFKEKFNEKKVMILEADEPLEDLYFNTLGSKHIFSFDSSALLNIYLESDVCIRNLINFNVLLRYNTLLEPIFKKFKFKIYK